MKSPSEPITNLEAAREAVGRSVHVRGRAANAKLGRVVLVDGGPIYCGEGDAWESSEVGQTVVVTGEIVRVVNEPPPATEISAGVVGELIRLERCSLIE